MVRLPEGYCIDSTEVTRAQYQAWLTTPLSVGEADSVCSSKTQYFPDATCMSGLDVCQGSTCGNHPQVCVDWCDAHLYCLAVGKRLCGGIGDGLYSFTDYANASLSQWYNACASDGTNNKYSYGNTYQATRCNGYDYSVARGAFTTVPVGTMPECQSSVPGYEGVFDLSGNVWEWEDSCDGTGQSGCHLRGGAFSSNGPSNCDNNGSSSRAFARSDTGFRCCS
jgi:formylglycine-generating enzyme required for sulfatase activity